MTGWLRCEEADLQLAAHAVGDLPPDEHQALRRHLVDCASCRAAGAAYVGVTDLLPLAVDDVAPAASLRSRILAAVHADVAGERDPSPPGRLRRMWQRIPAGRPLTLAGGLGTALATAAALFAVVTRGGGAPVQPAPAAVVVKHACGGTADPSACATLRYDPGAAQATLTVTGLTPIAAGGGGPGSTYEVWLLRANHAAVAAAFLSPSPDGSTWSAAMTGDMSQFVAVATTREPAGGSPAPSGAELLRINLTG